ncbi:MAG TPA: peroxiredoxin, partial [Lactococcus sp.]|nr:peroxiredoxin [Lactococcus sp.]
MSLIGKEVEPFVTEAYQNGKFLTVNSDDFKGKWNVIVFY